MAANFIPVFIGGTGRSGTTILLNLLSRHPDFHASMPREIKYLTNRHGLIDLIFTRPLRFEENFKSRRNNLAARALPLFGQSKLSSCEKEMFGSWWSELGKKGLPRGLEQGIPREVLDREFQKFKLEFKSDRMSAARNLFQSLSLAQMIESPKRYFGDSTPVNMMQADLIFQLLPDSKFVSVVRDGRDVASSVVKEKWGPNNHFEALRWWQNRISKAHLALSRIPTDRFIEIRIEDLVIHERMATFEKIVSFLDLESHPRLEKFFTNEILPDRLHAGRWKTEVANPKKFERRYREILQKLKAQGISISEL